MKTKSGLLVIMFLMIIWSFTFKSVAPAFGQCNLKFELKVDHNSVPAKTAEIRLKLKKGIGRIDFYLIDLKNPHKGPIKKVQRSAADLKKDLTVVFSGVPESNYIIQAIDQNKCQVSIGGIEGINISSN